MVYMKKKMELFVYYKLSMSPVCTKEFKNEKNLKLR
jgi:hypothetical protein